MRRCLFLGLVGALLFALGGVGSAQADNGPHVSSSVGVGFNQIAGAGRCASCHRAHTTQTAVTAGRDGLCLTCHGPSAGGATTDVFGGVGYGAVRTQNGDRSTAPGALRGGGFDYALIGSAAATRETYFSGSILKARNQVIPVLGAPLATTSKHGVIGAALTAWDRSALNSGAGAAVTLECGSCHDPHGNGNYRVLRTAPVDSGASTAAVGVTIPDASVKVYTTANYWLSGDAAVPPVVNGVKGGTAAPDGHIGNITRWCTTCHQRNHLDTTIKMTGTTCVTCHVAHGSNASELGAVSSPVQQPDGSTAASRGSLLRVDANLAICVMCHIR
ncbi:MAG TPA: cytochrome c3 family protein [Dermatophilaceae bacterium]|nr:cytochrome c3 family protein [Dermatophilaceae bacterium]